MTKSPNPTEWMGIPYTSEKLEKTWSSFEIPPVVMLADVFTVKIHRNNSMLNVAGNQIKMFESLKPKEFWVAESKLNIGTIPPTITLTKYIETLLNVVVFLNSNETLAIRNVIPAKKNHAMIKVASIPS